MIHLFFLTGSRKSPHGETLLNCGVSKGVLSCQRQRAAARYALGVSDYCWFISTFFLFLFLDALAHNFKQTTGSRFSIHHCEACHKGFTGFMKQALRCVGKQANDT